MISLYSNWWIKPGMEAEAIPILQSLAERVRAEEPSTLMYLVHFPFLDFPTEYNFKSEPAIRPGAVTFVETYASWKAFDQHFKGRVFKEFVDQHGDLFVQAKADENGDSKPFTQVVFMDKVAGFIRKQAMDL